MCILGSVLHMLLLLGFLTVVKNVECDAIETKKTLELFSEIKKKIVCFLWCFRFSELNFYRSLFYEKKAIKSSCVLTSLCPFGYTSSWLLLYAVNMLVAYLWNVTTLWLIWCCLWWVCVTGEGVCPLCPSTLLLHFFNQQQKKALFWPVCQQCPASTPLQL